MMQTDLMALLASAPLHTQDTEIWFGCPGVTAATELLNIRLKLPHGREEQTMRAELQDRRR